MKQRLFSCSAISAFILCSCAFSQRAHAQSTFFPALDSTFTRYGVFGQFGRTAQSIGFTKLPGFPEKTCCPDQPYDNTVTTGFAAGVLGEYPLTRALMAALRVGYANIGSDSAFVGIAMPSVNTSGSQTANAAGKVFEEYRFTPRLSLLTVTPMLGMRPSRSLSLYVGVQASIFLQKNYSLVSQLPDGITYDATQTNQLTLRSNEALPQAAPILLAATGGLSYEVPLNRTGTTLLSVEAFYTYGLNSPVQGERWKMSSIRGGISLRFAPYRTTELSANEIQNLFQDSLRRSQLLVDSAIANSNRSDSLIREARKQTLSVRITNVSGIAPDGKRLEKPTLTVETADVNEAKYVLSAVFFTEGSAVLPSRYKRILPAGRGDFSVENTARLANLGLYYHVLNVVGKRLAENPQATITLVGCNADAGMEKDNRKLSRLRAEAVAGYLQDVWRITPERMELQDRNLPEQGTNARDEKASEERRLEECRRVEIRSNYPVVLSDVLYRGVRRTVTPSVVDVGLEVNAGAGLKQWNLECTQFDNREEKLLFSYEGGNIAPEHYLWKVDERQTSIPPAIGTMDIKLSITDVNNRNTDAQPISIPVEQKTSKEQSDAFSFLLTSNEAALVAKDVRVQQTTVAIKQLLKPTSRILITGNVNNESAQTIVKILNLSASQVSVVPNTATQLFDAVLPEGRFYNRLIYVEIRTPKQ